MNRKLLSFFTVLVIVTAVVKAGGGGKWKEKMEEYIKDVCGDKPDCPDCMKKEMKDKGKAMKDWKDLEDDEFIKKCEECATETANKCEADEEKCKASCQKMLKMKGKWGKKGKEEE